jgi:hypothetical protein
MDKRIFGMAGALALVAVMGCSDSGSDGGPSNSGAGAMGGGGGVGGGGAGGLGGAGAGGVGGVGGGGGVGGAGAAGGVGGVGGGGVGGASGTMGGSAGTSAGSAGTEAGSAGSAGTMMVDSGVNDTASCIAEAAADGRTGACPECGCMKCLAEIMNCQDEGCQSVVACGQAAGCSGSDCYCGIDADPVICAILGAEGPCMNEIAVASGLVADGTCTANNLCASPLSMLGMNDPDNAVQRARALSICTQGQEASPGSPPTVPASPEIMGMCEAECGTADAGM